ncbi:hypothetical protein [Stenotrophomonas sp. B1-1]|uniref:hypothetical protein n=1 Tax=Stenotrophomonas sp. B1-1 TaxID=2710648 RepID=UPI0013D9E447|nr:hypothetical protein [Stenotrophomonas sp. B1-1]
MKISAHLMLWLAIAAAAFAGGCYWQGGLNARSENRQLRDNLQQLSQTADALRQNAVQSALNYDAAVRRLDEVARAREEDREHIRQWAADQQQALQALARAQPELGKRAGAGVLQHWNRSNAGPDAADSAPADAAGQPGAAVPGATGGVQRRMDRADRQPRPGERAVSRLPQSNGTAAGCNPAVAGHRLAVVLRSGARCRPIGGALPA